ncbi:zinc-binding dehydrogenase [Micromonospora cremea]|uniref:zinc-binding dehydrogenase n=1 Tax=Micromonospora cremea TaxID=709881 RepID=UPI000A00FA18|nr:zinc-binding dehydrogenase [Micromonospora cremea]
MNRQLRGLALSRFVRQRITTFIARQRAIDLERLTDLLEAGKLTPSIGRTYPLEQVPQAMRHLADGKTRGKVAITI